MKILVLTKRTYTNKDVICDQYGRLYEIPRGLSLFGHDVRCVALSYRPMTQGWYEVDGLEYLSWYSLNAVPSGLLNYSRKVGRALGEWRPDIIWASSDMVHGILGTRLSSLFGVPYVVDFYDNYEAFGLSRIIPLRKQFIRSCQGASGFTFSSEALRQEIVPRYGISEAVSVIRNSVDASVFFPREKRLAREYLGLPQNGKLVGTAGALEKSRGIDDLFRAFLDIATRDQNAYLVVAGPSDQTKKQFHHPRIIDLGVIAHEDVPYLFSALDVGVICNKDSKFGHYCCPMKLKEMVACSLSVVCAKYGDAYLDPDNADVLFYDPGDVEVLSCRVRELFEDPGVDDRGKINRDWVSAARELENFLLRVNQDG